MKLFQVPLRAVPVPSRATPSQGVMSAPASMPGQAPFPTELTPPVVTAPRPASVSPLSWEALALHVDDAQKRSAIAYSPLRVVVQAVVRELRHAGESWESVYSVLRSAVVPVADRPMNWATEYEMHTSRSASLVAHMHSWADVERLAEIERNEAAG